MDKIKKWFKLFNDQGGKARNQIGNDYFELLELIVSKYSMFNKATCACSFTADNVFLSNDSQFAFGFQGSGSKSLVMTNCRNGKKKWVYF